MEMPSFAVPHPLVAAVAEFDSKTEETASKISAAEEVQTEAAPVSRKYENVQKRKSILSFQNLIYHF